MNPTQIPTPITNPVPSYIHHHAANVYSMQTIPELIKYLHQACWSPTVDTWCKAIDKGFFATFPGLTSAAVRKHLPPSTSTTKGHMRRDRQHVRSTSTQRTIAQPVPEMTTQEFLTEPSVQTNLVMCKTIDLADPKGLVATNQMGQFPIRSLRGNHYMMVAYVRDANTIIVRPIKDEMKPHWSMCTKHYTTTLLHAD